MEIEGSLQIHLYHDNDRVTGVSIDSTRPLQAVKVFHGKPVDEMLHTLPLLYHVCGIAQANAIVDACEQAMGVSCDGATKKARNMLVWVETAREHLWRILMDWADILGEEKNKESIIWLQHFLPGLKKALFDDVNGFYPGAQVKINEDEVQSVIDSIQHLLEEEIFAMPADEWLANTDKRVLVSWLENNSTIATRMLNKIRSMEKDHQHDMEVSDLPVLDDNILHERLTRSDADDFISRPLWHGNPCETTVLSRQKHQPLVKAMLNSSGKGIMTRMIARLTELASIPATLNSCFSEMEHPAQVEQTNKTFEETGIGIGQVEAARGRLIHRLEMEQGKVKRLQILAPTEWNFHPGGIVSQMLKTLPVLDKALLKQQAELLINTIDPCVRYQLTVH